ncbi:MAG: hypothetical protein ACPG5B_07675 [Chitinophagales bacterium]
MYFIQESDVVQLLKALDNKERKKLANNILSYLRSINTKQSHINHQIFVYISCFAPKFNQKKFSKINLLSAIPSLANETEIRFNKRMAMIKQAIFHFITDQNLQQNDNEVVALLHILAFLQNKKKLNHIFIETQTKIKNRLEKKWQEKHIDTINYHYAYQVYTSLLNHEAFKEEQMLNFQASLYYSEAYFLCQQIIYYCHLMNEAINKGRKSPTYYDNIYFKHLSEVLPNLPKHKVFKETIIQMYYKIYLLLKNFESDDKSYYENYITFLFESYKKNEKLKNFEIFRPTAQQNLFAYAQNYFAWKIRKINKKIKENEFEWSESEKNSLIKKRHIYTNDLFDLYELQLKNDVITEITANLMRNIVLKKFEAGLYDDLEVFLEKYMSKIEEKNRTAVTKYSYAHLHFAQKEYKEVVKILLKEDEKTERMPNYFFKLDVYRLLIKSQFEIIAYEALEMYIGRFRTYLTNNETTKNKALFERHKRFLVYVKEVLEAIKQKNNMILKELKEKIERKKDTVDSEWLLEKIDSCLK